MNCEEALELIEAYGDDELVAPTRAAVAAHLSTCASCQQVHAQIEGVRARVRAAGPVPMPDDLEAKVRLRLAQAHLATRARPRRLALYGAIAACQAVVLLSAGGIGAWLASAEAGRTFALEEAVSAHVRLLGDEHAIQVASNNQHTVKPWFADKLDFSPAVVDLTSEGFPLLGGRLDYVAGHRVAALIYSRQLHKITVFVSSGAISPGAEPGATSRAGLNLVSWRQGDLKLTAVSDLNAAELGQFARVFRDAT